MGGADLDLVLPQVSELPPTATPPPRGCLIRAWQPGKAGASPCISWQKGAGWATARPTAWFTLPSGAGLGLRPWSRSFALTLPARLCCQSACQGGLVLEEVARGWFRMDACHLRPEARVGVG